MEEMTSKPDKAWHKKWQNQQSERHEQDQRQDVTRNITGLEANICGKPLMLSRWNYERFQNSAFSPD